MENGKRGMLKRMDALLLDICKLMTVYSKVIPVTCFPLFPLSLFQLFAISNCSYLERSYGETLCIY